MENQLRAAVTRFVHKSHSLAAELLQAQARRREGGPGGSRAGDRGRGGGVSMGGRCCGLRAAGAVAAGRVRPGC